MIVDDLDLLEPELLNNDEIARLLPIIDKLLDWGKAIKEYALKEALKGNEIKGFKLVRGTSRRTWKDEAQVINKLINLGINEDDIYQKKLKGITAIEGVLGRARFKNELSNLVEKPQGAPTLVPNSDSREELSLCSVEDFN